MAHVQVLLVMGSASDREVMAECARVLQELAIPYRMTVASAHRTPDRVHRLAQEAQAEGVQVIIAGAGGAAHLAGVLASLCLLPVIGIPLEASSLGGLDALLSTVQMPAGIPVATVAIGRAGARNAAFLAARILALQDPGLRRRLEAHRREMVARVEAQAREVEGT